MISRRGILTGLGALICAPAIVRVASLMPIKSWAIPEMQFEELKAGDIIEFSNSDLPGRYVITAIRGSNLFEINQESFFRANGTDILFRSFGA